MNKRLIKSILLILTLLVSSGLLAQDGDRPAFDSRYIGVWKGNWLKGMSSGGVSLDLAENGGTFSFTGVPSFGAEPASISHIKSSDSQLELRTAGADGHIMRLDLKPSSNYQKLKGKVYYEGLHMEVELTRAQ